MSVVKVCSNCRHEARDLKRCSLCKIARYCSKSCQKAAFNVHERNCKAISEVKVGNEAMASFVIRSTRHCDREYTWSFVKAHVSCEVDGMLANIRDPFSGYMIALKEVAILEGNMKAAELYLRMDWVYRQG